MIFSQYYLDCLSQASYLVGDESSGRAVVVDPRRTETAKQLGTQVFIRPDTDVYFLLSFLHEVLERGGVDRARVDAHMRGLPRTHVLAGSVADGRVTYITRSRVFGFPDYTTLEQDGDRLKAYARLRFGGSDLGVNATRLERLRLALE